MTPITIIVKSVWLSMKMTELLAKWRKLEKGSASNLWLEMEKMKEKKKKVVVSFSQLKMMEINLEAIVQLFVLITFNFVPRITSMHGLGSEFDSDDQDWSSWLLLVGSTSLTAFSVISSTLTAVSLSKGGQLMIKAKVVLGTTPQRYLFLGSTRFYTIFWVFIRYTILSHDICNISDLVKNAR